MLQRRVGAAGMLVLAAGLALAAPAPWTVPAEKLKGLKNPATGALRAASEQRGAVLYKEHCQGCHGVTGKGDGEDAAYYDHVPSNLTLASVAAQSDAELFVKITEGRTDMVSYAKKLDVTQRWDVVNQVRTLKR